MKNTTISVCLLTAPLILSGCLNSPKPGSPEAMALLQKERQDEQRQIQQNIISETPDWFTSPRQSDVALYAAGTAKQATLKQASFAAESDARNRLIRALDSYIEGIFDDNGKPVIDKKTKEPKSIPDPAWILFEKCMRGDSSDNVFSAFPGVRKKGTKNKVGLLEAYEDKDRKGFNWNNLMLQRWVDHNEVEHRVLDDYERNRVLIDLTEQPPEIKEFIDETIDAIESKNFPMVGAKFLKFCGKYDLKKISDNITSYAEFLQSGYRSN